MSEKRHVLGCGTHPNKKGICSRCGSLIRYARRHDHPCVAYSTQLKKKKNIFVWRDHATISIVKKIKSQKELTNFKRKINGGNDNGN